MDKRFVVAIIGVVVLVAAVSTMMSLMIKPEHSKMKVVASIYPFAEIARQVGKDKIELSTLTPPGVESHDFEPSPKDLVKIQEAKIFVYSGAGFEPWADKAIVDLKEVTVVNAGKGIKLLPTAGFGDSHNVGKYNGNSHNTDNHDASDSQAQKQARSAKTDPHFYLDPICLQHSVDNVTRALCKVDARNASYYRNNASEYKKELLALDSEYRKTLFACKSKDIVTSHAAFAYLAKRYGLRQVPLAGMSEEEPSPARIAGVVEYVKQHKIKYIFVEKLVSPRLSETVAGETGAKILVLNPLEGLTPAESKAGKDYISIMHDNLANLKTALGCKQ
jgi:zinc transport system substrate-binding protein